MRAVLRMLRLEENSNPSPFVNMIDGLDHAPGRTPFEGDETMLIMSRGIHELAATKLPLSLTQRFCSIASTCPRWINNIAN